MVAGDDTVVRRYSDAMERRGTRIVLRRIASLPGGDPQPNPPTLVAPVLDGAFSLGATVIAIRASQAVGRLLAGDALGIGGSGPLPVVGTVVARGLGDDPLNPVVPGFDAVPLAVPLPANMPDGAAIVPVWRADQSVFGRIEAFPMTLGANQIITGDLRVVIAAFGVERPTAADRLLVDDIDRSIVNVERLYAQAQHVAWVVQAR